MPVLAGERRREAGMGAWGSNQEGPTHQGGEAESRNRELAACGPRGLARPNRHEVQGPSARRIWPGRSVVVVFVFDRLDQEHFPVAVVAAIRAEVMREPHL